MRFNTPYDRIRSEKIQDAGEKIVETSGYIPAKEQVEMLMRAGANLNAWRKEQYDFARKEDVDDNWEDVTRRPNFDRADATQINRQAKANIKQQKEDSKTKATEVTEKVEKVTKVTEKTEDING